MLTLTFFSYGEIRQKERQGVILKPKPFIAIHPMKIETNKRTRYELRVKKFYHFDTNIDKIEECTNIVVLYRRL